jgi:hypothetical protein
MWLDPAELGQALVDMASGNDNSPHQAEVQHRWRHLLALRGFDSDRNGGTKGRLCGYGTAPKTAQRSVDYPE